MNEITVRPARKDDYPALISLRGRLLTQHAAFRPDRFCPAEQEMSRKDFLKMRKPGKFIWLVAADADGRLAGYTLCDRIKRKDYSYFLLDEMYVEEARRGQGVGTLLMDAVKDLAAKEGASLELEVWEPNPAAVRFYERCGFTQQRRRLEWPAEQDNSHVC